MNVDTEILEDALDLFGQAGTNLSAANDVMSNISTSTNNKYAAQIKDLKSAIDDCNSNIVSLKSSIDTFIQDIEQIEEACKSEAESLGADFNADGIINKEATINFNTSDLKVLSSKEAEALLQYYLVGYTVSESSNKNVISLQLDDYYKDYLNNLNVKGSSATDVLLKIATNIKTTIANQQNDDNGSHITYSDVAGINIPSDFYQVEETDGQTSTKKGRIGDYVDCSSYISMILHEYAIATNNTNLEDMTKNYRVQSGGSDLGEGGQIAASQLYEADNEYLSNVGLKSIDYASEDDLQEGDILVTYTPGVTGSGHTEIYVGKDENGKGIVYSCGSELFFDKVENSQYIKSGSNSKIIRIIDSDEN